MKILILYYSHTGHTKNAADAVAAGIQEAGGAVTMVNTKDFDPAVIADYDGFVVGSPCWQKHFGDGPPQVDEPTLASIGKLADSSLAGKLVGGFVVTAETKGHRTLAAIEEAVVAKGGTKFKKGPIGKAGSPMSDWKGPNLMDEALKQYHDFGKSLVS
ncbi:MAG: flavodoxin family protein [Spirochaetes bacterium]|nr:flavodoxin family protein [Spirochaetota bacterium]